LARFGRVAYPILFAISLVLAIALRGAGQYRASDLALVTTVVVIATALALAVVTVLVRVLDRTPRAAPLAALLTMLLVTWFFFYVPAQHAAEAITWRGSRDAVLMPLGILATIGIVRWLVRQSAARLESINRVMLRFGVLLVVVVGGQLAFSQGYTPAATRSAFVRQLTAPLRIAATPPPARNEPKRDIYLIVLDGHANMRVAQEVAQLEDSSFMDSLRALGFVIPREMHSNYTQTILSLPSLLNASHLTGLTADAGIDNQSFALPGYLVENNRAARFLRKQGYKYVLFPSMWWTQTQHSPLADEVFDNRPDRTLSNEVRRTELRQAVFNSTLLRYRPLTVLDTLHERRTMEGLKRLPADPAPTFAFAHILLPHIPYYLDASCHVVARPILPEEEDASPAQRAARTAQQRCVDSMVLDVVTTLLRDSRTPPVILVVGDHGSRFAAPRFVEHPDSLPPAFMRERFGAFGAFHAPAGGDSLFAGSASLVNVMGNVLRFYFGADLQPQADDMYVSGTRLFHFYPVDSMGYLSR
jgi:hypothetical protein